MKVRTVLFAVYSGRQQTDKPARPALQRGESIDERNHTAVVMGANQSLT